MSRTYDDTWLCEKLKDLPYSACITDPNQPDNPIVFVNDQFCEQTGYTREQAIGRNCRFLQCVESDQDEVRRIREAIDAGEEVSADVLNRFADGGLFWNRLSIKPIHDDAGQIQRFMAVQMVLKDNPYETLAEDKRRSDTALSELHHRLKNHLTLIHSSVRLQMRDTGETDGLVGVLNRIQSLQSLYSGMRQGIEAPSELDDVDFFNYLSSICTAIAGLDENITFDQLVPEEPLMMDIDTASQVGMMVAELVTNSMRHAFDDNGGKIVLRGEVSDGKVLVGIEDNGRGLGADQEEKLGSGLGGKILKQTAKSLSAELDFNPSSEGMSVSL
ncbi:PAS domain-containing protein [Halocynthiibacter sp. C4]|uniref:PAS domain-containing protein n=1 Tax=Halocynthiibacter sp. C4 TaxID=2992758 RepID=UPI00237AC15B|nr:PAS domain-containing protein [Halocynthiibacter sp. C4]MDE0589107.1 PAS domain-containing protein [Halocynthiibacter sp. C4]